MLLRTLAWCGLVGTLLPVVSSGSPRGIGVSRAFRGPAGSADSAYSAASPPRSAAPSQPRQVYVSAADSRGSFIDDLQTSDFSVKEGGKERDVIDARAASAQMQIALLVDDNGTGIFRAGVARFVQRLQGRAEFALSVVVGQTQKVIDYTTDSMRLFEAVRNLNARPSTPDGGQLLEGIYDSAKELERKLAKRPVIVVLSVGGEEHSTRSAGNVLDQIEKSGAGLHVFLVTSSALRTTVAIQRPSALLDENHALSRVLGDGPKQSGGRHDEIVATTGVVNGLQQLAEELLHQYVISYALPDGVKPSGKIEVRVSRAGVSLRAPTRVPSR